MNKSISHQRLDRYISKHCNINRKAVKLMLAQRRLLVDGNIATTADLIVNKFSDILLDGRVLQKNSPVYVMLHKPVGVVSSTKGGNVNERLRKKDPTKLHEYKTVIDLLTHENKDQLHIVGRLDLNTSGLVLLTNDSRWSKMLTSPDSKVEKRYRVTLKNKLSVEYIYKFEQGIYLSKDQVTTRPAQLSIVSDYIADVVLTEGRFHQIKRMFGHFSNPVVGLHRYAIGHLPLDKTLKVSESRTLTTNEVTNIHTIKNLR